MTELLSPPQQQQQAHQHSARGCCLLFKTSLFKNVNRDAPGWWITPALKNHNLSLQKDSAMFSVANETKKRRLSASFTQGFIETTDLACSGGQGR